MKTLTYYGNVELCSIKRGVSLIQYVTFIDSPTRTRCKSYFDQSTHRRHNFGLWMLCKWSLHRALFGTDGVKFGGIWDHEISRSFMKLLELACNHIHQDLSIEGLTWCDRDERGIPGVVVVWYVLGRFDGGLDSFPGFVVPHEICSAAQLQHRRSGEHSRVEFQGSFDYFCIVWRLIPNSLEQIFFCQSSPGHRGGPSSRISNLTPNVNDVLVTQKNWVFLHVEFLVVDTQKANRVRFCNNIKPGPAFDPLYQEHETRSCIWSSIRTWNQVLHLILYIKNMEPGPDPHSILYIKNMEPGPAFDLLYK